MTPEVSSSIAPCPTVVDGRVSLVVPDRVLRDAAYPLTVDPTVSDPVFVPGNDESDSVSVAFNGSKYLVAWQSDVVPTARHTNPDLADQCGPQLRRCRSRGLDLRDQEPRSGCRLERLELPGRVAEDGAVDRPRRPRSEGERRWPSAGRFDDHDLDPDHRTVEPHGVRAGTTAAGSTFYVTWADNRNGNYDIYGARIDNTGTILDPSGKRVTEGTRDEFVPDVAWNGTSFQVVYLYQCLPATDPDIWGNRSTARRTRSLDPQSISTTLASERDPAVASDGTKWLAVMGGRSQRQRRHLRYDPHRRRRSRRPGRLPDRCDRGPWSLSPTLAWRGTYLVGYIRLGCQRRGVRQSRQRRWHRAGRHGLHDRRRLRQESIVVTRQWQPVGLRLQQQRWHRHPAGSHPSSQKDGTRRQLAASTRGRFVVGLRGFEPPTS